MCRGKIEYGWEPVVNYIAAAAVIGAGAAACLLRGFFFAEEMYAFLVVWFVLCAVIIVLKFVVAHRKGNKGVSGNVLAGDSVLQRKGSIRRTQGARVVLLGGSVLILALYAIHLLRGSISAQGTMNELLRWGLYASFAVVVYTCAGNRQVGRLLIAAWHGVGMTLCLTALLAVCGVLPLPFAIAYSNASGVSVTGARLGGLLEYPNTFGAVMAVFLLERLFSIAGVSAKPSTRSALLRQLPLFPYAAALLLSESRGAWLAAACAAAAVLPWKRRLLAPLLTAGAAPVAAAALLYRQLAHAGLAVEPLPGLLALAGLWAGALLAGLWLCRRQRCAAAGWTRAAGLALAAVGWTAAGTAVLLHVHARIIGPSSTVSARGLFYRDAWKLAAEAPWLGRGGETWASAYLAIQSHPYVGSQVHNGYLDILLNLGIVGLTATALILLAAGWLLAMAAPQLLPPFLVLTLHSAVDFDWSYGLVWLLLLWLPALAVAEMGQTAIAAPPLKPVNQSAFTYSYQINRPTAPRRFSYPSQVVAAAVCCACLSLSLLSVHAYRGIDLYRQAGQVTTFTERTVLLQKSLDWNPYAPGTIVALSRMLPTGQATSLLQSSLKYAPEDAALSWELAERLMREDNLGVALYWIRRSLQLDVYNYVKRVRVVEGLLAMGQGRLAAGRVGEAQNSAAAGMELLRQYRLLVEQENIRGGRHNDRHFRVTEEADSLDWRLRGLLIAAGDSEGKAKPLSLAH
ncbi:O-antigen ligase family protein [Paenibacillus monticola]|uniref:O-antigen ligase domain-containing protein n=1 Tax=Paenibacillus monticola TaxID=2666075 RepID=A0A7X2L5P1_9BACL|nr:O-antigen ligase family protein [Paenibacillus monticola]MRN56961.1 O-antigen ligase domain-containing protein [Paenibacillus monticola]